MAENPGGGPPAVSVVVPFYDSVRHIGDCIEALRRQERVEGGYELVFIDNGSSDGSAEVVRSNEGVVVLREEGPGAYRARNTGIRYASAPLIAFTDADCIVASDWIRSIQLGMADREVGVLVGKIRYPPEASWALRLLGAYENTKLRYVIEKADPNRWFAHANNMAVRRSVFDQLGLFREWKRAGDTEFVHRMRRERPDLRLVYRPTMRVTHMEFTSSRQRLRRMRLYSRTNSKVEDFDELTVSQRLRILAGALRHWWRG